MLVSYQTQVKSTTLMNRVIPLLKTSDVIQFFVFFAAGLTHFTLAVRRGNGYDIGAR